MKKAIISILASLLLLVNGCSLVACDNNANNSKKPNDNNSIETPSVSSTDLKFKGAVQIDTEELGSVLYINFPNKKLIVSLNDYIEVDKGSSWSVSTDIYGNKPIPSKTVDLVEGANLFYILVENSENKTKQYTILIKRNAMFTVSFENIKDSIIVEEGEKITAPSVRPTKSYSWFVKWDFDFNQPITEDVKIKGIWEYAPISVEVYIQYQDKLGNGIDWTRVNQFFVKENMKIKDMLIQIPQVEGFKFKGYCYHDSEYHWVDENFMIPDIFPDISHISIGLFYEEI